MIRITVFCRAALGPLPYEKCYAPSKISNLVTIGRVSHERAKESRIYLLLWGLGILSEEYKFNQKRLSHMRPTMTLTNQLRLLQTFTLASETLKLGPAKL